MSKTWIHFEYKSLLGPFLVQLLMDVLLKKNQWESFRWFVLKKAFCPRNWAKSCRLYNNLELVLWCRFFVSIQESIQKPVKYLRCSVLRKKFVVKMFTIFLEGSIGVAWKSSEYGASVHIFMFMVIIFSSNSAQIFINSILKDLAGWVDGWLKSAISAIFFQYGISIISYDIPLPL